MKKLGGSIEIPILKLETMGTRYKITDIIWVWVEHEVCGVPYKHYDVDSTYFVRVVGRG